MHENRLYILEGTVPDGYPEPAFFQQSVGGSTKTATASATRRCITMDSRSRPSGRQGGRGQGGRGGNAGPAGRGGRTVGRVLSDPAF